MNGGLVLDDLQRALDPGISVRVTSGWTVEVKDHQFVVLSCQLQEGPQAADRLFFRLQSIVCSQRADCTKRIVLEETIINI